mmetsp:Transcript_9545/g.14361  ORF Transcript_9545/g.14361 Transcript_9545/m.14361 type:complete len:194 (-) Transcript_9545:13-594(-)
MKLRSAKRKNVHDAGEMKGAETVVREIRVYMGLLQLKTEMIRTEESLTGTEKTEKEAGQTEIGRETGAGVGERETIGTGSDPKTEITDEVDGNEAEVLAQEAQAVHLLAVKSDVEPETKTEDGTRTEGETKAEVEVVVEGVVDGAVTEVTLIDRRYMCEDHFLHGEMPFLTESYYSLHIHVIMKYQSFCFCNI